MNKHVVISCSGGMDSSTLLLNCLEKYKTVTAISFDYGQKHYVELERITSLIQYINESFRSKMKEDQKNFHSLNIENEIKSIKTSLLFSTLKQITHKIIKLDGLQELLHSTLMQGGSEVPEGHYEEKNQRDTVVPNRNKIFSSIIQAVALSIVNKTGEPCDIALGIHKGDFITYRDCRQEFRDLDYQAFLEGNWDADRVRYYTPYINLMKYDILKDGERLCKKLDLDFNEVYSRTNTSYKPINLNNIWYSSYKDGASVERIESFIKLGKSDPVLYADETGPVSWEIVTSHVNKILEEKE